MQDTATSNLRSLNRKNISELRKENRSNLLRQKRILLSEVEPHQSCLNSTQFNDLVLKLRQKKMSLENIKILKNNCCDQSNIEVFFRTVGAFDSLVRIFVGNDALLQLEAAACITNLACGSHKASQRIAKATGAYLVTFISSGSCYLQDQSSWAAGNIVSDCIECYKILKAQGLLLALNTVIKSSMRGVMISAVYALNACSKYEDPDFIEKLTPESIRLLLKISIDKEICMKTRTESGLILANAYHLAIKNNINVSHAEVDLIITNLCMGDGNLEDEVAHTLIRCLGFLSVDQSICQKIAENLAFSRYMQQIFSTDCVLKGEALWLLTNIINSCTVLNANFLLQSVKTFLYPGNPYVMQALYFLCTVVVKYPTESEVILKQFNIITQVEFITKCGTRELENAALVCLKLQNVDSSCGSICLN